MTRSLHALRDEEIYLRSMRGEKTADLAAEFNLSENGIRAVVIRVGRSMPERDRSELLARSIEHLDDMRSKVLSLYSLLGAPVTAGQHGDVLIDPETDEVVRDHSLKVKAIEQLLKIDTAFAKRLGLDAPTQAEVKASVQYEIVGVDPEALT